MAKPYRFLSPTEQRRFDRIDLLILKCLDRGWSYRRIHKWLKVAPKRISKVNRECR